MTAPKIMGVELPERAICRYPDDLLPWKLEPHYSRNVAAMTAEGLHSKAEIAMQLAWRDQRIAELDTALARAAAWIPRTDCLPKPGDEIVARSALYEPVAGWIEVDQGSPDGLALVRRHGLSTAFAVFTHWMPIPPEWKIAEPASVSVNIKALKEHTG